MEDAVLENRNHFHFIHRKASGEKRYVEVYSTPITIKGKAILYSIIHDISERKVTEEKLKESEERFRRIIEASPDGMAISALDGTLKFVSEKK